MPTPTKTTKKGAPAAPPHDPHAPLTFQAHPNASIHWMVLGHLASGLPSLVEVKRKVATS